MCRQKKLVDAVLERAHEADSRKKLTCAEAFQLAQEFSVQVIEVGRICNKHGIRISKCQLGCFA
jgi:hypothetical protein